MGVLKKIKVITVDNPYISVKALEKTGLPHKLTDMGTIIEGSSKELLALAVQLSEIPFKLGVHRVVTQISLDDRRDKQVTLGAKVNAVAARLKQKNEVAV